MQVEPFQRALEECEKEGSLAREEFSGFLLALQSCLAKLLRLVRFCRLVSSLGACCCKFELSLKKCQLQDILITGRRMDQAAQRIKLDARALIPLQHGVMLDLLDSLGDRRQLSICSSF